MNEDIEEILISEERIRFKVQELGMQITRDYQGKNLLLLGTLKGAVPLYLIVRGLSQARREGTTAWPSQESL